MVTCPSCGTHAPHNGPCPGGSGHGNAAIVTLQGRYELLGILGQGGMGTVYIARDKRLHYRPCVVKKLRDDFYREEDRQKAVSFFEREVGVLSPLDHENIVKILDYFTEKGDYFLVMEYVEGRDLHHILQERGQPFSEQQVVRWAIRICDVLQYLHSNQPPVIYRDLKPSNIMIDVKDRVKLVDFGIARPYEGGGDNTHVVSAGYSPPEQYWGAADPRSDIYALGATMFFLLTGKEPAALTPAVPAQARGDVSSAVDAIVQKCTAQDPGARYQTAAELSHELEAVLKQDEPHVVPEARTRLVEAALITGIIALAAVALVVFQQHFNQRDSENVARESERKLKQVIDAHGKSILEGRRQTAQKPKVIGPRAIELEEEELLVDPEGLGSK